MNSDNSYYCGLYMMLKFQIRAVVTPALYPVPSYPKGNMCDTVSKQGIKLINYF